MATAAADARNTDGLVAAQAERGTPFRKRLPLAKRKEMSAAIATRYPDCVAVIMERQRSATELPHLVAPKFLVCRTSTVSRLLCELRRQLRLSSPHPDGSPATAAATSAVAAPPRDLPLYVLVAGSIAPTASQTMEQLYARYADPLDGFLYITYSTENAFGDDTRLQNSLRRLR